MNLRLDAALAATPHAEIADLDAWWAGHRAIALNHPFERAVAGGIGADRLGYAFASGYVEALCALHPDGGDVPRSLAVTEQGAPTPSSIATTLRDGVLTGEKAFATLGQIAQRFLVAARRGTHPDGKADIALVVLSRGAPGLKVGPGPVTTFTPEVPHARLTMDAVVPDAVLPGDGYLRYLKPFRTVEDIHVHAATLGHLLRCARAFDWPVAGELADQIGALAPLAVADPLDPATHLALGDVLDASRSLLARIDADDLWARADDVTRTRWERDRDLLKVAGAARAARLQRARAATGGA